jgi:Tol biopolymer transport system component
MKPVHFITTFLILIVFSCHKPKNGDGGVDVPWQIPSPYAEPVWHPNGQILGFRHTPYKLVPNQNPIAYLDSAGFWLINADGTNKRRVLNFKLYTPAWSPDGNWLAYSDGATIYKIRFNGSGFDVNQNIPLTNSGKSFFPSWNNTGDSIAFDSWDGGQFSGYKTWKMAAEGSGKSLVAPGRQPRWADNYIYYIGSDSIGVGVLRVNTNGQNPTKIVNQPNGTQDIGTLRIWNNYLFYQLGGLAIYKGIIGSGNFSSISNDETDQYGMDVSSQGKIAYVLYGGRVNTTQGTIWLMNSDGSGKQQLTFNNF